MRVLALAMLSLFGSLAVNGQNTPVTLTGNGKPPTAIVLGKDAGDLTQLGAAELEKYLEQLSGVRPARMEDSEAAAGKKEGSFLVLGTTSQNRILADLAQTGAIDAANLRPEGFLLQSLSWQGHPTIAIVGADEAGALYGAYELLERLGISFRLTGDFVPARRKVLSVGPLHARMEPAFSRRGFLFSVYFDNASIFSSADYERFLDQMARMKCNYLQMWWFAYAPWVNYSYKGESKLFGDVSSIESGYHTWSRGGFGSRTVAEVSIGRERFAGHERLAPLEMQQVENPQQACAVAKDMLMKILAHAARRNIKVWLVEELASLPPNLGRHGELIGETPFNPIFGSFLHPLDPVNREIQVTRLKALLETYPQAEGVFLNFAELYPDIANENHYDFFAQQRPRFHRLRGLSAPWGTALANLYDVKVEEVVDSNAAYFDLFDYLRKRWDELAPGKPLGLMTTGRGYALPLFHELLPTNVPFASLESSGVWTMEGMPMRYFGDMGSRERIIQPRVDDDFDMLGMQFSVRQYALKDRILADGAKYGLSGFAGQIERPRGTEFNSSYLARAAWEPGLSPERFYRDCAETMFGKDAAEEMYRAFMILEENQEYLGYYEYDGGYGVLLCCSGIREVNATQAYWRQKNPFGGPSVRSWQKLIAASPDAITRREGSIALLDAALGHLRAALAAVSTPGRPELLYMINRTEVFRECLAGLNTFRRGMVNFDDAFRHKNALGEEKFVAQLEASLAVMREGRQQLSEATRTYSEILDHVSDLAVLYHLNARVIEGTDLTVRFLENIVDYYRGKPYLERVPFERLYPPRPDKGMEN